MEKKDTKIELIIPESWDEITVGKFEMISRLSDSGNDITRMLMMLTTICDIDVSVLEEIPTNYYETLGESLKWMAVTPQPKDINSIILNGKTYTVNKDWDNISFGEAISIEQLLMDTKDNPHRALSMVCGVMLREVKKGVTQKFNPDTVMELIDEVREKLPITEALAITLGFGAGEVNSITNVIKDSSPIKQ